MNQICKPDAALALLKLSQKPQSGLSYIPSQFVLPFTHNEKQYAFHMLTKELVETELPRSAHAGEGFDPLIESMFLVPEGKDECAFYESISVLKRLYAQKKGIPCYTILPTLGCNARCVYCYEEGRKQIRMTRETAEETVRYILRTHDRDKVKLNWFGGEPLLCPGIIDYVSDELQRANVPFHSTMVSNGSLVTQQILDKMLTDWKLKRIQVSMDGAEQDYIDRKRYHGNSDRYHFVLRAIDAMSEAGIAVSVRCNVDEDNWAGIPAFLTDMNRYIPHKEHVGIYFSPLGDVRTGDGEIALWKKILAARPLIEDAGFRPLPYMEPRMKLRVNFCMADGGSVVIGPDGSLYACEHCPTNSRFGDVFHGVTDEAARREFCRTDRTREKCRRCPFLPDCTSFASCPWVDVHCREVREMIALDALKRIVDRKETNQDSDEDDLVC